MHVELMRWPGDQRRLAVLRDQGVPRLLLVSEGTEPPVPTDCLEDWVAGDAAEAALDARRRALVARARSHGQRPAIDSSGLLRHHGAWVSLSPVEQALAAALLDRFGAVVPRDVVASRAWPDGPPSRNSLDALVMRLRRRLAPLDLEIRTVRSRGYVLQALRQSN
ncbi:MAG: helix-turn-helix domain-containing protein [Acidimicrobiia bacterium]